MISFRRAEENDGARLLDQAIRRSMVSPSKGATREGFGHRSCGRVNSSLPAFQGPMPKIRHASTKNKHRMTHWLNSGLCGNEQYGAARRVVYAGLFVRDRVGHKEHTMMRA